MEELRSSQWLAKCLMVDSCCFCGGNADASHVDRSAALCDISAAVMLCDFVVFCADASSRLTALRPPINHNFPTYQYSV